MTWYPHSTVATVVEKDGQFLMVEEGSNVFNQPAGHLEPDETIFEAAIRETLEETAWHVELTGFLGLYFFKSPENNVTYIRHCFIAKPIKHEPGLALDADIIAAHWVEARKILDATFPARSPLVVKAVQDYLSGAHYPLDCIYHHEHN